MLKLYTLSLKSKRSVKKQTIQDYIKKGNTIVRKLIHDTLYMSKE